MKHRVIFYVVFILCVTAFSELCGQGAGDPNEGARVVMSGGRDGEFKWWGRSGRTYFVQYSEDLNAGWRWLGEIRGGKDAVESIYFSSSSRNYFMRLYWTDLPTTDPWYDDFDGDGVSNVDELSQGTNPLLVADLDGNGLPDDWEIYYFGSTGQPASGDIDSDGLTNAQELMAGTDPTKADTDNDGVADGTLRMNFAYDLVGRLEVAREGAGATDNFGYDVRGNVQAATGLKAGNP